MYSFASLELPSSEPLSNDPVFAAGGQAGELMRRVDWAKTPLGPVEGWSQALRTLVGVLLRNHSPMLLWWGPDLVQLYNDAYRPVLGDKHPQAMGQPTRECWSEIFHIIGPMIEAPLRGEPATTSDDLTLLLFRRGFWEETHFRVAYSPIPDPEVPGTGIGGVLATVTETTREVYGQRQLRTLRELAAGSAEARSAEEACSRAGRILAGNPWDVPFALVYLIEDGGGLARRVGQVGFADGSALPPEVLSPGDDDGEHAGLLRAALQSRQPAVLQDLPARLGPLPGGRWTQPATLAVALPLASPDHPGPFGVLVAGVSPVRQLDEDYRTFLELCAAQVTTSIRNAVAHQAERRRAEALAEIDRAKTTFFANISHEFRTPLTLILGHHEAAMTSAEGALGGESLRAAQRNTLRLLRLVNTLLDFSRVEAGRARAHFEHLDLAAVTRDLASSFRSAVERAGLGFEVDCPPLPAPVPVDRDMWEKIVLNLVSNAFKFTFEGRLRVGLCPAGPEVELEVTDTGTGIAASELPRLFERFHRIEGARSRSHEGSGIGLALVQDLVRLHQGTIRVKSRPGEGTRITVRIPARRGELVAAAGTAAAVAAGAVPSPVAVAFASEAAGWLPAEPSVPGAPVPPASAAPTVAPSGRARVLVADDNADMRQYIVRLLAPQFEVQEAADGQSALEQARESLPDLVLTDVMMPGLDGFGLLCALREDPTTTGIPVVMLSARAGEESRIEGLHRGADDYLVKPFSARELLARVSSQIALARARQAAEQANRTKDQFLAMLGHELRNPLAPIRTALQLMRLRGHDAPEIAVIERQLGHLVRLVDDLLDVSRIARRQLQLKRRRVELSRVVAHGIEMATPLLEQRQQSLTVNVPPAGLAVHGDEGRLAQVVSNLLTNAAKYSEPGSHIQVSALASGERVRLQVKDSGMGIDPRLLARVFDLFFQQPQAPDRSIGGLGLGLAIVRSLVELHGGTVSASSDGPGRGSDFVVELPLARRAAAAHGPRRQRNGLTVARAVQSRILLVEDNEDAAAMLGEILEHLGHRVEVVHDGPGALTVAHRFHPEVCLLDLGLPVMDGYELAGRLRRSGDLPDGARIIAITGYGQAADHSRSQEAGFSAHLVKPVDVQLLTRLVAS
jgi:signal transduction histidine kinase